MDLVSLRIFKEVAEQGGVTRAAARLHRVQSNITTRVKQLEERLGTPLFFRQGRELKLTPEGHVLLIYADRLLRLSLEAEAALREGTPRGTFRLGTLESTAAARLPPILCTYYRAFPEVQVELVTGTTGALVTKVLNQELEAAFVAEPFVADDLETQPVFSEELVLIAPKDAAAIKAPKDLGHTTVIGFPAGCSYRRRLETWLARGRSTSERFMEVGSYHAIVACVAAGAGIAVVPKSVLAISIAEKAVSQHRLPSSIAVARTHLIWRNGYRSMPLSVMRDLLSAKPDARGKRSRSNRPAT
jgi:DNA-binding transcriptional LysR family regulator